MEKPERVMGQTSSNIKFLAYVDKLEAYTDWLDKRIEILNKELVYAYGRLGAR